MSIYQCFLFVKFLILFKDWHIAYQFAKAVSFLENENFEVIIEEEQNESV